MHKRLKGLRYPNSIFLTCAFVVAMLVSFAFSEPAFAAAAQHSISTAQHSTSSILENPVCDNDSRSLTRVAKHILYYGNIITCTGEVARISDSFSVQILEGGKWIPNASQTNACTNCSSLKSPPRLGSYSYTGAPNQHIRVAEVYGITFLDGAREGESGIIGPFVLGP